MTTHAILAIGENEAAAVNRYPVNKRIPLKTGPKSVVVRDEAGLTPLFCPASSFENRKSEEEEKTRVSNKCSLNVSQSRLLKMKGSTHCEDRMKLGMVQHTALLEFGTWAICSDGLGIEVRECHGTPQTRLGQVTMRIKIFDTGPSEQIAQVREVKG